MRGRTEEELSSFSTVATCKILPMTRNSPPTPGAEPAIPSLLVSASDARLKIADRIADGGTLVKAWRENGARIGDDECERQCSSWEEYNQTLLRSLFDGAMFLAQYRRHRLSMGVLDVEGDPLAVVKSCISTVLDKISRLESISGQIDLCPAPPVPPSIGPVAPLALDRLVKICRRFPAFVRQLLKRHNNRPSFPIDDEYDAQDLLHSILRLEFDDVRPEAWTPSYAGKSSRMDFLLKRERLVLEVKMTRDGLGARELGDQLIIDIDRYKEHQDCGTLICFIFDPERRLANPAELEDDLSGLRGALEVRVIVAPRD